MASLAFLAGLDLFQFGISLQVFDDQLFLVVARVFVVQCFYRTFSLFDFG
jgi:hypothetical protein